MPRVDVVPLAKEEPVVNGPLFLIVLGLVLSLVSWIGFRRPGQRFWFAGPVWRASRYLRPAGAALWVAGTAVSTAGLAWLIVRELTGAA